MSQSHGASSCISGPLWTACYGQESVAAEWSAMTTLPTIPEHVGPVDPSQQWTGRTCPEGVEVSRAIRGGQGEPCPESLGVMLKRKPGIHREGAVQSSSNHRQRSSDWPKSDSDRDGGIGALDRTNARVLTPARISRLAVEPGVLELRHPVGCRIEGFNDPSPGLRLMPFSAFPRGNLASQCACHVISYRLRLLHGLDEVNGRDPATRVRQVCSSLSRGR